MSSLLDIIFIKKISTLILSKVRILINLNIKIIYMNQLALLSPSHLITVCLSIAAIIYIPKFFKDSSDEAKKLLMYQI